MQYRFAHQCFCFIFIISLSLTTESVLAVPPPASGASGFHPAETSKAMQRYGSIPLHFEPNQGQTDARVQFLSRGDGYTLFLTADEAVLALRQGNKRHAGVDRTTTSQPNNTTSTTLRMRLAGTQPGSKARGVEALPGKSHYFMGSNPRDWYRGVPNYAKVRYDDVYPGIDLVYYGNQRQLEYDFIVAPGTDPSVIRLAYEGTRKLTVDGDGNLNLEVAGGHVTQFAPTIYQEIDGARRTVPGQYVLHDSSQVGVEITAYYDTSRPLIIDPVLSYFTFLGGEFEEAGTAITLDADGNAYITGLTNSNNFPTTVDARFPQDPDLFGQAVGDAGIDVFVVKLDPDGERRLYSTYLGGEGTDVGLDIAVDADGNAYVAGTTEASNFPVTGTAFQQTLNGKFDAFVAILNRDGDDILLSTYLGGEGEDNDSGGIFFPSLRKEQFQPIQASPDLPPEDAAFGIAVDGVGHVYVAGYTKSPDFPTTAGAFQRSRQGDDDAFVAMLDPAASGDDQLVYSTYFGGDFEFPVPTPIPNGPILFQTLPGPVAPPASDLADSIAFDCGNRNVNLDGGPFVGGGLSAALRVGDGAADIAVDRDGNVYITGLTQSDEGFPLSDNARQRTFGGILDAFVAIIHPDTTAPPDEQLVYSTYHGGELEDAGLGLALDADGRVYLAGTTFSSQFPTRNAFQPGRAGSPSNIRCDAFVTKLDPTAPRDDQLIFSSYLGGELTDQAWGIAIDLDRNVYLAGQTSSKTFPTEDPLQQELFLKDPLQEELNPEEEFDAFVTKINPTGSQLLYSTYFGREGKDVARGIATDACGAAYIVGDTNSPGLSSEAMNSAQEEFGEFVDALVAKIAEDPTCNAADRQVTLTVVVNGNGTVRSEPGGIACPGDCEQAFPIGTRITLTAEADGGNPFLGWDLPGCEGLSPCSFSLESSGQVDATFANPSDISGAATGISPTKVVCTNRSADPRQKVVIDQNVSAVWNCRDLGLGWRQGDTVQVKIVGTVDTVMDVGGVASGLSANVLVCKNKSRDPKPKVRIENPSIPWSCDVPDFPMEPGDVIQMKIKGPAN